MIDLLIQFGSLGIVAYVVYDDRTKLAQALDRLTNAIKSLEKRKK